MKLGWTRRENIFGKICFQIIVRKEKKVDAWATAIRFKNFTGSRGSRWWPMLIDGEPGEGGGTSRLRRRFCVEGWWTCSMARTTTSPTSSLAIASLGLGWI